MAGVALRRCAGVAGRWGWGSGGAGLGARALSAAASSGGGSRLVEAVRLVRYESKQPFTAHEGKASLQSEDKPVILMIGWLQSKRKHLDKYSSWYTDQGYDVVRIAPTPLHVASRNKGRSVGEGVVSILEDLSPRPIFVHGFSVGGYLYGQALLAMQRRDAVKHFEPRVIGQVYDSPVDIVGIPRGVSIAVTNDFRPLQVLVEGALHGYMAVNRAATADYMASSGIFKNNPLRTPTHVFYSARGDPIASPEVVEDVCEKWRALGNQVTTSCWEDSPHVQHMTRNQTRYFGDLAAFLSEREGLYRSKIQQATAE